MASDGERATGSDIEAAFADEPALVSYVAAGDPDAESTKEYVRALVRGGADVIELGLPFSEPIAEGPTIQQAIRRALDAGMTPERYFDLVADLREDVDVPLVCMTYYNLIYQYGPDDTEGPESFVEAAADAGISGLVVPDLPVDESDPLKQACDAHGLDLIFIVAPTTTDERLGRMLDRASGFVYVQGRLGTTGARSDVSSQTHGSLDRLGATDLPKAVGFGISERDHAREVVAGGADGVVVGSAFVDLIASQENTADRLEALARELKAGALAGGTEVPEPEGR